MTLGSTGRSKMELSMRSKGELPASDIQKEIQLQNI